MDRSLRLSEIVSHIDLTPTLLTAVGLSVPTSMKGKSLIPLVQDPLTRKLWRNQALIQISAAMVGRAIRTEEWTYCVADPRLNGNNVEFSNQYDEYVMYNNFSDPAQLVNLAGRDQFKNRASQLQKELLRMIGESGETTPSILPAPALPIDSVADSYRWRVAYL